MANDPERDSLVSVFRQSDLSRLLGRLVERLRRGRALSGALRLSDPSDAERRAIASLIGPLRRSQRSVSIDLDYLAVVATRGSRFTSLAELVQAAHGLAIADDHSQRRAASLAWSEFWRAFLLRAENDVGLARWLGDVRARAWIRRLAGGDLPAAKRLMEDLFAVLARLPAATPIFLAQLAAEVCGDSHALDREEKLGRLTARALAARQQRLRPQKARELRDVWAGAGIVLDELSATVLALNLPALPGTPLGDVLCVMRAVGEPCRLTFRQLCGESPCQFSANSEQEIFICENPSVVAAAASRWGPHCKPLVCVEGRPNLAAERLLQVLASQDRRLRYHGDFDWGGLRIAARLWEKTRFTPWRFTRADYEQAPPGRPLLGAPASAPWDAELAPAMQAAGRVVHEEAVLDQLLEDLDSRTRA